jgi:hypothetical protein
LLRVGKRRYFIIKWRWMHKKEAIQDLNSFFFPCFISSRIHLYVFSCRWHNRWGSLFRSLKDKQRI